MGASVTGVLTVDVGVVGLTVARRVGECELKALSLVVDNRVETVAAHVLFQKIHETVLASDDSFVELDRKTGVEVGVVPETLLDELLIVGVINEELGIGSERDKSPVGLGGGPLLHASHLDALLKGGGGILPVTEGGYGEFFRKRIDGLCTYTV